MSSETAAGAHSFNAIFRRSLSLCSQRPSRAPGLWAKIRVGIYETMQSGNDIIPSSPPARRFGLPVLIAIGVRPNTLSRAFPGIFLRISLSDSR